MGKPTGHIHAAPLTSHRLQKVLRVLSDGRAKSTRDIVRKTQVLAVPACVAELRHHGATISCMRKSTPHGVRYYYTLLKAPNT